MTKDEFLDTRDERVTPEDRLKFYNNRKAGRSGYGSDLPNRWDEKQVVMYMMHLFIEANLAAITPQQGYPNAPFYFALEHIKDIHKRGRLDKLLNPTIPAIDRYHFPQYLRDEIYAHARKIGLR